MGAFLRVVISDGEGEVTWSLGEGHDFSGDQGAGYVPAAPTGTCCLFHLACSFCFNTSNF